jgi:hypothetical protein
MPQRRTTPHDTGRRLTREHFEAAARASGCEWLGPLPEGGSSGVTCFRCAAGHEFSRTIVQMRKLKRCPVCAS